MPQECGKGNQIACTQIGTIEKPPCQPNPDIIQFCEKNFVLSRNSNVCQAKCGADCQASIIQNILATQNPEIFLTEPKMSCFNDSKYMKPSTVVSREDLPLERSRSISQKHRRIDEERIVLDIGGEGYHQHYGRSWGDSTAINVNCSDRASFYSTNEETSSNASTDEPLPIPNHVYGFAQHLPFESRFADEIYLQNSPVDDEVVQEIERVIRPGGTLSITGPLDSYKSQLEKIMKHTCVFPTSSTTIWSYPLNQHNTTSINSPNNMYSQVTMNLRVPTTFNYQKPHDCSLPIQFWSDVFKKAQSDAK